MDIRQESINDYDSIYQLVKVAFETAKMSDGHEQDLVNKIRSSNKYIPCLTLVAEEDGKIIGHIMLSTTYVKDSSSEHEVLYLAPVSVALEYRNTGIGSELIQTSMKLAAKMGYRAVFLAGDPAYYNRFGFVATKKYGIKCSIDVPEELSENIMVCELYPDALNGISGIVEY